MKVPHLRLSSLRLLSTLLLSILYFSLSAQSDTQVTLVDMEMVPLVGVQIYSNDYTYTGVSDINGNWMIPANVGEDEKFTFKYVGYQSMSFTKSEISGMYQYVKMSQGLKLDEVMIVGRTDQLASEMIHRVETISQADILRVQSSNSADALGQNADIFIQKSQAGGGSPVIRGFEANKVLLVLDGVRMNNAIYRSGHIQNAITVDNSMLQGIEVIYGPGSLMYGSDALGGVVHFRSKDPVRSFDKEGSIRFLANAGISYASANSKKGIHLDFNLGGRKLGSLTSLTYNDFGDLKSGINRPNKYLGFGGRDWYVETLNGEDRQVINDDPDLQLGTRYQQYDFTQKLVYEVNDKLDLMANFQYSTSSDIPRYDALTELRDGLPRYAEWNYGPQNRFLSTLQAKWKSPNPLFDKVKVIVAYQNIGEDRINRRFQSASRRHQEETVDVYTFTLDMNKYLDKYEMIELKYGLEYNHNDVNSVAFGEDINTGDKDTNVFTRYPSAVSSTDALGAYVYSSFKNDMGTKLFGGLRYTANGISVRYDRADTFTWPEEFYDGLTTENQAVTWSFGVRQDIFKKWTIQALLGSAFRSPNVDDLAKVRINSDEVSVPNLGVTPEKSINAEISISRKLGFANISVTGFYTALSDVIVRENFVLPDGTEFLEDEGEQLQVVANVNADKARIVGTSFNADWKLTKHWVAKGSINIIQGRIQSSNEEYTDPLAHIPPTYGKIQLQYLQDNWDIEARYIFNGEKPLDEYGGSTDNPELSTVDGTYTWSTFNLYGSAHITDQIDIRLGIENILNTHYRPFASGVSGPGRNLLVSINYTLK